MIRQSDDIKYKERIKIINFNQFLEFLNIPVGLHNWRELTNDEKQIVKVFQKINSLVIESINSDEKLDELINFSEYCLKNLL